MALLRKHVGCGKVRRTSLPGVGRMYYIGISFLGTEIHSSENQPLALDVQEAIQHQPQFQKKLLLYSCSLTKEKGFKLGCPLLN